MDRDAELVVCGIDFDLTYDKLKTATLLIRGGARFIGTNPDSSFPSPEGLVPGAGSILALLESASGCAPIIIGKPERGMFEAALRQAGAKATETLMIGDRIGTDIIGAAALGIKTALVMTGVETEQSLRASETQPDLVFAGLPELVRRSRNSDCFTVILWPETHRSILHPLSAVDLNALSSFAHAAQSDIDCSPQWR